MSIQGKYQVSAKVNLLGLKQMKWTEQVKAKQAKEETRSYD